MGQDPEGRGPGPREKASLEGAAWRDLVGCSTLGGARGLTVCPLCRHASPTGLLLTAVVALIYMTALLFEE